MKLGEKNPAYFDTALTAFNHILTVDPTYSAAYEYAGLTEYYQKDYPEAIRYFLKKVELDSTSINTYRNLAFSYLKTEQYGSAARTFARALELKPDDVMMRSLLAKIYSVNKDYSNSVAQYERILNNGVDVTDSLKCEIYPDLGAGYLYSKNYQAAVTTLLKAERCQPNDYSILMNIAIAYVSLDKVAEAHTYYGKALDVKPNDKEAKKGFMQTQIQGKE
jgi:tetratricopeptide (TPR) repeat protein